MLISQIPLCNTGPQVSRITLGLMHLTSWNLSPEALFEMLNICLDIGITTFDHADIYGDYRCEGLFGAALEQNPSFREKIQIITKCGIKLISNNRPDHSVKSYDTSKAHIIASVENSLKLLHTDYIDLLLIHRPDPLMDADETAEGLTSLRDSGKVLHVGVSNFTSTQFNLLASRLDFPLVTNQIEFSVMAMHALNDGTLDLCQQLRISPMAWSPFAGGRIFQTGSEQAIRLQDTLNEIGQELGGNSIDQVALAWILTHPAKIVPVLGSGNLDRIKKAAVAENISLSREQWFRIWQASVGTEVP